MISKERKKFSHTVLCVMVLNSFPSLLSTLNNIWHCNGFFGESKSDCLLWNQIDHQMVHLLVYRFKNFISQL